MLGCILWRLASALRPIASDYLGFYVWCSPRHGLIGTHHGTPRCETCGRRTR